MDLALDRRGDCVGTYRMGSDGGTFEIVKRGDEVWMKADWDYWKNQLPGEGRRRPTWSGTAMSTAPRTRAPSRTSPGPAI